MTIKETASKVGHATADIGKQSIKGLGIIAGASIKLLSGAAEIQRKDAVRKKLESIDSWDLPIALEIIQERLNK